MDKVLIDCIILSVVITSILASVRMDLVRNC